FSLLDLTPRQVVGLGSLKFRDEEAGRLTAGEFNEHDLAGFHELLLLAKSSWPDQNKLLQTYRLVDKDGPELAVLEAASLNATQHLLMNAFLVKSAKPLDL